MSIFYLVRHAHATWTPDENRSLSDRGRADAERVADLLRPFPTGAIYSSPYRRAIETIEPLATRLGLPVQMEPDLRERDLGVSSDDDFTRAVKATWQDPCFTYPGGESNAAAQRRGVAVVYRLQAEAATAPVVLSTHGNLLALILQHFDPSVDFGFWNALTMPDIYLLRIGPDGAVAIERLYRDSRDRDRTR